MAAQLQEACTVSILPITLIGHGGGGYLPTLQFYELISHSNCPTYHSVTTARMNNLNTNSEVPSLALYYRITYGGNGFVVRPDCDVEKLVSILVILPVRMGESRSRFQIASNGCS